MSEVKEILTVLKGAEFLIRESKPEEIFIPEDLNEEQKMIRDMAKEFVDTQVFTQLDAIDSQQPGLVPSLLEAAGELGLLGISVPEKYQGFEKDFNTETAVAEIVGAAHAFSVSFLAHTGIGTLPILYFGTEEQKQKYLPNLVKGVLKVSYCLTEPGSGSDALAAKTKAVLSEDGKNYILNGQKMWITNAGFSDIFIVFAKIDGKDFTAFIVERNSEGLSIGAEEHKMGIKGSSTCQVFFENCKVPVENILGEKGRGHIIAFNILNIGRYKLCAAAIGGCKRSATISVKYANEREQFGTAIANFGAIKYKISEQAIRTFAVESALWRTSNMIDDKEKAFLTEGKSLAEANLAAAEEFAIECAMLKVLGSEVLDYVVDEAVQIYGGYGYSEEYPVARAYRDSRINRIFEGTNEINRLLTMDMLLKRAIKGELDLMTPAFAIQKELMSVPDFGSDEEGMFAHEIKAVRNMKKAFLLVAGAAVQKLMMQLKDEQEILMAASDVLMEIFAAESMLLRIMKLQNRKSETEMAVYKDMMQVFINDSLDRVHRSGTTAINSFATADDQKMMLLGLKRFTKYPSINTTASRRRIADVIIAANAYCF
ncbi:MAG: acyl-CoA dehydrogenase family protein [Chitinophagales bacterium]|nr:acyl-CoA dehydrogenase family protein [Chitinophagales bacterium]MBP8754140.1 acyl-CoA dehydrogenase family protein [Chitinophagales bacterium]MBP9188895.1 acyl-CoA dehydrogenase family protein [Chitinophagales bacterium]MBP9704847.1 acyl-CoA dehydrogenase family protein [Chitinophagales bacterium]